MLPGFIATEGFPQAELVENPLTRRLVSTPGVAAEAIREAARLAGLPADVVVEVSELRPEAFS